MSQVWGISLVKDESDIIEYTVRQLFAEGIDGAIVADNLSTDRTRKILVRLSKEFNLTVIEDAEVNYWQSQKMTALANAAHALGADWIIPFDADEMFYSTNGASVAEQLRKSQHSILSTHMLNYFSTGQDDPSDLNPLTREQWRKVELNRLDKVCFRWQKDLVIAPGNHLATVGSQVILAHPSESIFICHFQNRSPEHFIRKIRNEARAYQNANVGDVGYWHKFGHLSDQEITDWWMRDYFFPDPRAAGLVYDPAPYHEKVIA